MKLADFALVRLFFVESESCQWPSISIVKKNEPLWGLAGDLDTLEETDDYVVNQEVYDNENIMRITMKLQIYMHF